MSFGPEEAGVPGKKPRKHGEKMMTPHRNARGQPLDSNL